MPKDLDRSALLIMDVQPGIIERIEDEAKYRQQIDHTLVTARKHQILTIFVVVGFRPSIPEVGPSNKAFAALKQSARDDMINPKPAVDLVDGEVVVTKRRVSAFTGSDLEVILRANGVTHLVLAGIATSGVVLSTLREAADKDYELTVLEDLCRDFDPEVHEVLTTKVFPRQAAVMSSDEWIGQINKGSHE